jgi:hypothetical protein
VTEGVTISQTSARAAEDRSLDLAAPLKITVSPQWLGILPQLGLARKPPKQRAKTKRAEGV